MNFHFCSNILYKIYDHIGDDFNTKEEIDEFVEFI